MKAGPPNDSTPDGRFDENDPVWDLLAQAPRPEPDAWFAVRTMARCRNEGLGRDERVSRGLLPRVWQWALGGGIAVCLTVALCLHQAPVAKVDKQQNVQEAFEIMASIDTDSDSSSPTSWQDSSL